MRSPLFYLCFSICFPILLSGQNETELTEKLVQLNQKLDSLEVNLTKLVHEKNTVESEILNLSQKLKSFQINKELGKGIYVKVNFMGGSLRDKPSIQSAKIIEIPPGDSILILREYSKPYFKAVYRDQIGYISYSRLEEETRIKNIVEEELLRSDPEFAKLKKEYDAHTARRILDNQYWIGMTRSMARESLGNPKDINTSRGPWGVHEQWVYSTRSLYLYFENDKLTSIQE